MSDVGGEGLADSAQETAVRDLRAAIDEALHTLPEGESSGVCSDCGKEIESARLKLLPGTTQCAACAQKRSKLVAPVSN